MRLLKRHPDESEPAESDVEDAAAPVEHGRPVDEPAPAEPPRSRWRRTVTVPMTVPERSVRRTMTVPARSVTRTAATPAMSLGRLAAVVLGAALAVVGTIALIRAGVDRTWYRPQVEVLDADHTALLGLLELAGGLLLLVVGLMANRVVVAALGIALAVVATAAAVDPAELQRELAIERWWAWTLAAAGVALVLASLASPLRHERTVVDVT